MTVKPGNDGPMSHPEVKSCSAEHSPLSRSSSASTRCTRIERLRRSPNAIDSGSPRIQPVECLATVGEVPSALRPQSSWKGSTATLGSGPKSPSMVNVAVGACNKCRPVLTFSPVEPVCFSYQLAIGASRSYPSDSACHYHINRIVGVKIALANRWSACRSLGLFGQDRRFSGVATALDGHDGPA